MHTLLPIFLITIAVAIADLFNVPAGVLQIISLSFLGAAVMISTRLFTNTHSKTLGVPNTRLLYILVICASLLLVAGSGGIFSPFLVLIHVVTFGIGIMVSFSAAAVYLCAAVLLLMTNLILDPIIRAEFFLEPGLAMINLLSMAILLPIMYLALNKFHLKEFVVQQLKEQIALSEAREDVITQGLQEGIVVCNKELEILSANHRFRDMVGLEPSEIVLTSLFSVVTLWDMDKDLVSKNTFDITHVIEGTETLTKHGYYIQGNAMSQKRRVDIHIRPVIGITQTVEQVVCVITSAKATLESSRCQTHEHIFGPLEMYVEEIVHGANHEDRYVLKKQATILLEHIRDASASLTLEARLREAPTITDVESVLNMAVYELEEYMGAFPYRIEVATAESIPVVSTNPVHQKMLQSTFLSEKYTALVDGPSIELLIRKIICIIVAHMIKAGITDHTIVCNVDSNQDAVFIVCTHNPTIEITYQTTRDLMEQTASGAQDIVCSGYELKIIDAIVEDESIAIDYNHDGAILITIPRNA